MDFLSSNSLLMMEKSMGFLWTKQAALSDNIANSETPGYQPKVVTFEETLRERLQSAASSSSARKNVRQVLENSAFGVMEHLEETRMDGNGVNVTEQSVEMVRNAYQLQYVFSAINSELNALRSVVRG